MDPHVNNKHAINRTPTVGIDPPWTAASTLRTIGVLADVAWPRGQVAYTDRPSRGFATCDACLNGTEHELYRPVRDLDQLVAAFFGLREPADVVAFVTRYGFLTNRHGDPQRPAQVDVMGLLFRTADLREFRRLALEPLSHLLLDDAQLLDRADTFRGTGSEHSLRPHVLEPRGKRPSGGLRPRCRASRLTPTGVGQPRRLAGVGAPVINWPPPSRR